MDAIPSLQRLLPPSPKVKKSIQAPAPRLTQSTLRYMKRSKWDRKIKTEMELLRKSTV